MMGESENGFEGWAILELMGHRRLGGRISEATIAGAAFIRIDVPDPTDSSAFTASQFYAPAAVYAITPTTGDIACAIARNAPQPVSRWDLPALTGGELGSTSDSAFTDLDVEELGEDVDFEDEAV